MSRSRRAWLRIDYFMSWLFMLAVAINCGVHPHRADYTWGVLGGLLVALCVHDIGLYRKRMEEARWR